MSETDEPRATYSESEAALALRRAASLQLEAAERADRRSVLGPPREAEGYGREDLLAAAREVGIDPSFLRVALAELGPSNKLASFEPHTDEAATRWLGTRARSVSVSRRFAKPAPVVWPTLTRVCESLEHGLRFAGVDAGHPLSGGVARFHMIRLSEMMMQRSSYTALCYRMEQLEVFDLRVVLRAEGDATDVTMFVDLRAGVGRNLRWARVSSGVFGTLFGAGALAAGLLSGPLLAAGAGVLGVLAGAGASLGSWRLMYRSAATQMGVQLERLFDDVERSLQRDALMLPIAETSAPVPAQGHGDISLLVDGSGS